MVYKFTISITRIHFTICKVRSDNSNPGNASKLDRIVTKEKYLVGKIISSFGN